ncbi:MAG: hypothetical protein SGARI_007187, partial [Bacillariaceae sp.]
MPPTAAAVRRNNTRNNNSNRNRNRNNALNAVQFSTSSQPPQHPPYFLGAPITKLLCMIWMVGSLVIIRSGNVQSRYGGAESTQSLSKMLLQGLFTRRFFFHSTSELVIGLGFLAQYMRRLERELSSRRMILWFVTVQAVRLLLQVVALSTLDFETAASYLFEAVKGPYAMVGAVLYWYWAYVPRVYPRFVSLPMVNMNFSEKTFGFAWASYVAISSGTASLLMVALGMVGSAVFYFLLTSLKLSMDVPNWIANMLPWDSFGNLLLLDSNAKVYAPLLLVQRDNNDGFGGMGAA